jgi:hypothetical protein
MLRVSGKVGRGSAAQQRVGEGEVGAGHDNQRLNLEHRSAGLPLEERRPGGAVGADPPYPLIGRRHVEHDDVRCVVCQHGGQVAVISGRSSASSGPAEPLPLEGVKLFAQAGVAAVGLACAHRLGD